MIKKDTVLLDLVEKYPATEDYFRDIDRKECVLCHELFDSIEDISKKHGLDLELVLEDLEKLL